MITEKTAVKVLKEFLSQKLGRQVSTEEALASLKALDKAYNNGELKELLHLPAGC